MSAQSLRLANGHRKGSVKLHTADRFRGPNLMIERYTNAKAALIGFLHGLGQDSQQIAKQLDDGTMPETIRALIRAKYDLPRSPLTATIWAALDHTRRHKIKERAEGLGITPEEFARRVLICVIDDDLYTAVIDGRKF